MEDLLILMDVFPIFFWKMKYWNPASEKMYLNLINKKSTNSHVCFLILPSFYVYFVAANYLLKVCISSISCIDLWNGLVPCSYSFYVWKSLIIQNGDGRVYSDLSVGLLRRFVSFSLFFFFFFLLAFSNCFLTMSC